MHQVLQDNAVTKKNATNNYLEWLIILVIGRFYIACNHQPWEVESIAMANKTADTALFTTRLFISLKIQ